ncbi:hypothetical protein MBLNU13_g04074t1 [Cladosporium sp. NU13]
MIGRARKERGEVEREKEGEENEEEDVDEDEIPNTTDEAAINDAVFDFCESFHADGRYEFPERVNRLNFLFRAYSDDEELFDPDTYADFQEARNRRLSREITKYHGVRSLISELAFRKSGVCDNSARVILE